MHHLLAFANLFIGDSQTMAAEAAVLGTPFIRYNDFVGKIGYLNELEETYKLGYGFRTSDAKKMLEKVRELVHSSNLKKVYQKRRKMMLLEKINLSEFLTWFIIEYPESVIRMREDPKFKYNFNK